MNYRILLLALAIIFTNTVLVIVSIIKMHFPYSQTMLLYTLSSLFLWFILLKKEVPLSIKSMDSPTFKATLPLLVITIGLSLFMMATSNSADLVSLSTIFATSLLVALYEEVIFRGIGLGSFLSSGITPAKSIILSSMLFSLFHIGYLADIGFNIIFLFLNTFMMGFILGYIYYKTKNILLAISIHFLWDFTVFMNQQLPTPKIALVTTIILLATTVLYFSWSIKKLRGNAVTSEAK